MSESRSTVLTKGAPAPPPFLSQANIMANFVFCSGQVGVNPDTGKMVEGSIQERTKQIMNNLKAVLEAAGTNLNNVVKFNIYLTDMANFGAVNEVYVTFLTDKKPARTCVCVKELPLGTDVEIECTAGIEKSHL